MPWIDEARASLSLEGYLETSSMKGYEIWTSRSAGLSGLKTMKELSKHAAILLLPLVTAVALALYTASDVEILKKWFAYSSY